MDMSDFFSRTELLFGEEAKELADVIGYDIIWKKR